MKRSFIILPLVLLIAGCSKQTFIDPFAYSADPVARAAGVRWSWEPNTHYDAGLVMVRSRQNNFARDTGSTNIHMAFDINNAPVQVSGVEVNGVLLPWIPTAQALDHAQIYASDFRGGGYGPSDSATFQYVGYDSESWKATVEVAPDFGDIISPDTIVISQGLKITYAKAVPGDSIHVSIFEELADQVKAKTVPTDSLDFNKMLPDSGAIIIPPSLLPHVQGISDYVIQVNRFHFSEHLSPKGKRIGVYSEVEFPAFIYPARP